jgi:hypothetical protein
MRMQIRPDLNGCPFHFPSHLFDSSCNILFPPCHPSAPPQYGAGVRKVIECPKNMVGRVIGRGGETIKTLQRQLSCSIQIDQTSMPCTVTVTGGAVAVAQAGERRCGGLEGGEIRDEGLGRSELTRACVSAASLPAQSRSLFP